MILPYAAKVCTTSRSVRSKQPSRRAIGDDDTTVYIQCPAEACGKCSILWLTLVSKG